jgi:3-oxoacyl-[acyl-carrier-protein] synthase-1
MNKVYITSYSAVSSLGTDITESINSLKTQKQPLIFPGNNDKFNRPYFKIKGSLNIDNKKIRSSQIALKLFENIENDIKDFKNITIFGSTSTGGIDETEDNYIKLVEKKTNYPLFERHFFNKIADDIKEKYKNINFESMTFSTACSSSGHSIMQAYNFIKNGIIDKAIILGVDILSYTTIIGFDSLKLVSITGTKPLCKNRDGLSLGEGGGILLLESNPKNNPIAEITGAHSNVDAYHISSPNPEGTQQKICMLEAMKQSGITDNEIDYINAHGTGTIINDEVEMKIIKETFKKQTPVTSLKAFIGHTLGASAITEIALALGMIKNNIIYQLKIDEPMDADYIPVDTVHKKVNYFLKNSFGFGGNNVSIVVKYLH